MKRNSNKKRYRRGKIRNKRIQHYRRARKHQRMVEDHAFYREWQPPR